MVDKITAPAWEPVRRYRSAMLDDSWPAATRWRGLEPPTSRERTRDEWRESAQAVVDRLDAHIIRTSGHIRAIAAEIAGANDAMLMRLAKFGDIGHDNDGIHALLRNLDAMETRREIWRMRVAFLDSVTQ